mmetsp:Transcript_3047/g.11714  ORF Transcript_3047/g.11714 Transcript_3047/m.11714 type:complete len:231 (-) Transcript_3047:4669-5361(-)
MCFPLIHHLVSLAVLLRQIHSEHHSNNRKSKKSQSRHLKRCSVEKVNSKMVLVLELLRPLNPQEDSQHFQLQSQLPHLIHSSNLYHRKRVHLPKRRTDDKRNKHLVVDFQAQMLLCQHGPQAQSRRSPRNQEALNRLLGPPLTPPLPVAFHQQAIHSLHLRPKVLPARVGENFPQNHHERIRRLHSKRLTRARLINNMFKTKRPFLARVSTRKSHANTGKLPLRRKVVTK